MFRVKICGITNVEDAIVAVEAGADAIGLNYYKDSPRRVDLKSGGRISSAVTDRRATPVGVFVNHVFEEIQIAERFNSLDAIQLHGDEPPQLLAQITRAVDVIRVRRMGEHGLAAIVEDIEACRQAGRIPDALLIDAALPGSYGGTGTTASWGTLAERGSMFGDIPLILAGGLTPDNVAEAIRIVRPAAVDVASGVESAPGKKDPVKVRDFVANALGAFEALGES
jgi:phosphoribosylanthranilate isomerase